MFRKRLKNEAGYSLIEVMVSIIILAVAILPMAGMFDMGINTATQGGQYDKARALANMKLEEAKSLPFATVRDNFPQTGNATPYDDSSTPWPDGPSGFEAFDYRVEKEFMTQPSQTATSPFTFSTSGTATNLIRVTVIVGWDYNPDSGTYKNTYTTYGLVSQ